MYTYDVYWEESDIAWSSRWDAYLRMPGGRVRHAPLANCRLSAETHAPSLPLVLTQRLTCCCPLLLLLLPPRRDGDDEADEGLCPCA